MCQSLHVRIVTYSYRGSTSCLSGLNIEMDAAKEKKFLHRFLFKSGNTKYTRKFSSLPVIDLFQFFFLYLTIMLILDILGAIMSAFEIEMIKLIEANTLKTSKFGFH